MHYRFPKKVELNFAAAIFATVSMCMPFTAIAESDNSMVPSSGKQRQAEFHPNPSLVNKWYYEGCLTGCASGYEVGYLIAIDQKYHARREIPTDLSAPITDWPQGKLMREIQTELDDILSNEPRSEVRGQYPAPTSQVLSTPQQLPIRHAGIYSTFHAGVHDGFKDGYSADKPDLVRDTNIYLKRYAANHLPNLPGNIAGEILQRHYITIVD